MLKIQFGTITKNILQEDGSEFLEVPFDLLNDEGESVHHHVNGYPLDKPTDEIIADVTKYAEVYQQDLDLSIQNAAREEAHKKADETIEALNGKVLAEASESNQN